MENIRFRVIVIDVGTTDKTPMEIESNDVAEDLIAAHHVVEGYMECGVWARGGKIFYPASVIRKVMVINAR